MEEIKDAEVKVEDGVIDGGAEVGSVVEPAEEVKEETPE